MRTLKGRRRLPRPPSRRKPPAPEGPWARDRRLAEERDVLWDKPGTCAACKGKARHGAIVGGQVVPLCSRHVAAWDGSAEQMRAAAIREAGDEGSAARELRALADRLGRLAAEARAGGAA